MDNTRCQSAKQEIQNDRSVAWGWQIKKNGDGGTYGIKNRGTTKTKIGSGPYWESMSVEIVTRSFGEGYELNRRTDALPVTARAASENTSSDFFVVFRVSSRQVAAINPFHPVPLAFRSGPTPQ